MGGSPRGDIGRGGRGAPAATGRTKINGQGTGAKHQSRGEANLLPASLGCLCCLRPRGDLSAVDAGWSAFAGDGAGVFVFSTAAATAA